MKNKYASLFATSSSRTFASFLVITATVQAADISYKSSLTSPTEFTTATNWVGGVAPTSADIPTWLTDVDAVTAGNQESTGGSITVATPISVLGMKFRDSVGAITMTGSEITLGTSGMEIGWENIKISNVIAGSSGLVVNRFLPGTTSGTLEFAGANTFTGGVTLNTGATVKVSNALAFGTNAITAAGNSTITAGTTFANNISVPTGINLTLNGGFVNVNGVISGDGRVTANNSIQVRGTNTYAGGTTVSGGFLCIDRDANLGAVPASFTANNLTLTGGGLVSNYIASSPVVLDANRGVTLNVGNTGGFDVANQSLRINGVITGDGSLYKQGGNTLILPAANTYTGGTKLNGGTVQVSNTSALGTGAVTITGNSTINAQNNFANNITINTGVGLGFGGGFALVQGVVSGLGRIQTSNSGVMTGDNTYEGGTNITGGFLCISKDSSLGLVPASPVANNINLSAGGCLSNYPATFGPAVTLNANRGITIAAGTTGGFDALNGTTLTINGIISGAGGVRTSSSSTTGTFVLNGLNTYTGKTVLFQNTTVISSIKNVGDTSGSSLGNPADVASGTIDLGSGAITTTLRYVGTGDTTDRAVNLPTTSGGSTLSQSGTGLLKFTGGVTATGIGSKTLTLSGSTAGTGEISGPIADNTTVGTTGLAATFALGATTVTLNSVAGIAVDANISGTGIAPGTTILGINPSTRVVNLSTPTTAASGAVNSTYTIDGVKNATAVTKSGTGTWALSGTQTYTGATTVNGGTLTIDGTGASLITVNSAGKLAPGTGIGSLTAPGVTLYSGGTFDAQINSSSGTADKVTASSYVELFDPTLALTDLGSGNLTTGTKLTLIDYTGGTLSGTFSGLPDGSTITLGSNRFSLSYDDGSKVTLTVLPGGYSTWASTNANNDPANVDTDGDGVLNGVEYFMGETASSFTTNPALVGSKITWPKDPTAVATYVVQTSIDLSAWSPAVTGVVDNGTSVEYTVPTGDPARFARIKVTTP